MIIIKLYNPIYLYSQGYLPGEDRPRFLWSFNNGIGGEGPDLSTNIDGVSGYENYDILVQDNKCEVVAKDDIYFITGCYSKNTWQTPDFSFIQIRPDNDNIYSYMAICKGKERLFIIQNTSSGYNTRSEGTSVCIDSNKNVFFSATFDSEIRINKKDYQKIGKQDSYIVKASLNYPKKPIVRQDYKIFYQLGGANSTVRINKIRYIGDKSLLIVGQFDKTILFPGSGNIVLKSGDLKSGFYAKVDIGTGNTIWAHKIDAAESDIMGVEVCDESFIYLTGYFRNSAFFEPDKKVDSQGNEDIFIAKVNQSDGECIWVANAGGNGTDKAYGITITSKGTIFITGTVFDDEILFNGCEDKPKQIRRKATLKKSNIFLAAYNSNGEILNSIIFSSPENSYAYDIKYDGDDYVYITGAFLEFFMLNKDKVEGFTTGRSSSYNAFLLKIKSKTVTKEELEYEKPVAIGGYRISGATTSKDQDKRYPAFGKSIAIDSKKNVYLAGYSVGNIYFGDNEKGFGEHGVNSRVPVIFLTKYGYPGEK